MRHSLSLLLLSALCACTDDGPDPGHAKPSADAGAQHALDATTDAGPSTTPTIGNGLVVSDAALQAVMALSPEQRMQPAHCDSGPVDGGIGMACTPRGGECRGAGLTCTADFRGDGGICTRLGCGSAEDCAPGASCCTLLQAGGVSLCFPDACYPTTCLERFQ